MKYDLTSLIIRIHRKSCYILNYHYFASFRQAQCIALRSAPVLSEVEGREGLFTRPTKIAHKGIQHGQ